MSPHCRTTLTGIGCLAAWLALAPALSACARAPRPTPTATVWVAPAMIPAEDAERTVEAGGMQRTYLAHIPPGLPVDVALPLVMVFHGYSGSGESIAITTGFDSLADRYGFLVVYPDGSGPTGGASWNAGGCCGYADGNHIDDIAFVRAILDDLRSQAAVDPRRIYAAGFSNGAMFSYRLACEMADTFAAVAPVAGVLLGNPCRPAAPVAVVHLHGQADASVPYAGDATPAPGRFESVQQSIAAFVQFDACPPSPRTEQTGIAVHEIYAPCKNGTAVELYTLQGIGHTWPPDAILPASQIIWNFFAAHPKK